MSTQLIKPNYLVIFPPTQHHSFFRNLPPLFGFVTLLQKFIPHFKILDLPLITNEIVLVFIIIFSLDFRVACLKVTSNLFTRKYFTNRVKWDNTEETVRKKCANFVKKGQYKLFALGRGGVCLSGENMTVKYHASDTYNATCNHGIGIEESMFVYSLGKHGCSILTKRLAFEILL